MKTLDTFTYSSSDFLLSVNSKVTLDNASKFDEVLQRGWNKAKEDGFFRYRLDNLETNIIPGKYKFVAQLNIKRAEERRKPEFIASIQDAFNPNKFNFTKIKEGEIIFNLKNMDDASRAEDDKDVLMINISPLEYGHCLLACSLAECQPQVINQAGLASAIQMLLLSATPAFRIAFNSLGAFASVNHYHWHSYYCQNPLYIETADVKHLAGECYELRDFPSPAYAFQVKDCHSQAVAREVMKLGQFCLDKAIAHNVLITRGSSFDGRSPDGVYDTIRIYFWVRTAVYGAKNDFAFNPAACELGGHLPIKTEELFHKITEEEVCNILSDVCLDVFLKIRDDVKQLFTS